MSRLTHWLTIGLLGVAIIVGFSIADTGDARQTDRIDRLTRDLARERERTDEILELAQVSRAMIVALQRALDEANYRLALVNQPPVVVQSARPSTTTSTTATSPTTAPCTVRGNTPLGPVCV